MRTDPMRKASDVMKLKLYFMQKGQQSGKMRNYALIVIGLNTALRCSDILSLVWNDVYDFEMKRFRSHITLIEKKTKKLTKIRMNRAIIESLSLLMKFLGAVSPDDVLFKSQKGKNKAISRIQMYRIIKSAAKFLNIDGNISCHSLRKTFGYNAYKSGVSPAMLMELFNHSSFAVTRRYVGIDQDEKDKIFLELVI